MKTIQWPDNLKYPGTGWALARIDGAETIISTHQFLEAREALRKELEFWA